MYDVTVTNNYRYPLTLDGGSEVFAPPDGGGALRRNWGSHRVSVPGMGDINFIDLGEEKLEAYTYPDIPWTEQAKGGLIRYRGLDAYFRYDGQGKVDVTVDRFGSVALRFAKGGMIVNLADLTVSEAS